jgi:hypothetical protein
MAIDVNKREYFVQRVSALRKERASFIGQYQEIQEFIAPRRGRFTVTARNRGEGRHSSIINSAGLQASRVARAGLLAGVMSPSRPWFSLETLHPDLMESHNVKVYLSQVELLMRSIHNQSNLYNMSPVLLGELLDFGTGAMIHMDDFNDVARFYTLTAGSYMIAQNQRYEVDTLVREFQMTTEQMVKEYGLNKVSRWVKDSFDRGAYDDWHDVIQVIEPNPNTDERKLDARNKPFRSVHYEPGNDGQVRNQEEFLRVSGFDEFPAYVPRWAVAGEDIYGTDCPGMIALGDVKGVQIEEKRRAQAIDKMVNPPLRGPATLKNVPISTLPGSANLYSGMAENKLESIYQVNPHIAELSADIQRHENRIQQAYYADMFLAISNMDGIQPRNMLELTQRNEERLLQLGPVLEQLHGEFLEKMIERTFKQMARANMLPPPPPELEGTNLKINFISSLARAQRAVATGGIERLTTFVGQLAAANPSVLDKVDMDQAIDEYATAIGVSPRLVVPDEAVAEIRAQRAQQQQMAEQMAMANQAAQAAKTASEVDASEDSLLGRAIEQQQGN